ncbi:MAG: DUF3172 domain-containing protein [Gomphosphaeria aponina SAG 52.96 = DSM 107014]|uniref:DUF3172 domain-containing protein n=1 Tax=Gomphosphaeria aponina SAG 52.96 = DSM 107014 TaxID=1521640 RepID=A0A941JNZ0_9CHRO|nr:DUF3172 domain-containing protein [Gomphosphaeria aponina SAG 52.96 = DSM 107014]
MKQRSKYSSPYSAPPKTSPKGGGNVSLNYTTAAILAGVFVLGIGLGILLSSGQNTNTANVASREFIDRSAPNPELCVQFGASAIVSDLRVFITMNPFNVFVTQPSMQPGCVLRRNNWSILEKQGLVTSQQVNDCKVRMNTFGFTGPLEGSPNISCIYQNNAAENLFLDRSGSGPKETEKF